MQVELAKFTRREFGDALDAGKFRAAIVPTGSNEQHLEHLAMEHDIVTATHVATEAAKTLYPDAVVSVPMAIGISEHHMEHRGTISAKPGPWLSVLFDAVESLTRHGIKKVLILNGHGGNTRPMEGILPQWKLYFGAMDPDIDVQFHSYWDLSRETAEEHCKGSVPGHAQEYETAFALALFPENVRVEPMQTQEDRSPLDATAEQGVLLDNAAVEETAAVVRAMLA